MKKTITNCLFNKYALSLFFTLFFINQKINAQSCPQFYQPPGAPFIPNNLSGSGSMVVIADFDDDGDNDVASTMFDLDSVAIMFNNGSGNFPVIKNMYSGGSMPYTIATADFDGDGKSDWAVANSNWLSNNTTADITVIKNNGQGLFGGSTTYTVSDQPIGIVAGDIDGDGDKDLAVTYFNIGMEVYKNNGVGSFSLSATYTVPGGYAALLVAFDADGDNDLDIATPDQYSNSIYVFTNNGTGLFGAATSYSLPFVGGYSIIADDFDNDGDKDLVTSNLNDSLAILTNVSGTFTQTTMHVLSGGTGGTQVSGDFDTDGDKDIMVCGNGGYLVYLKNNLGIFTNSGNISLPSNLGWILAAKDLNGDNKTDIAIPYFASSNEVTIYLQGSGLISTTSLTANIISSTAVGAFTYQWIDCATNLPISGATAQNYTATSSGNYAVTINNGTCTATSTCVNIIISGVDDVKSGITSYVVYPNPNNGNFVVSAQTNGHLIVSDLLGKVIADQQIFANKEINFTDFAKGVYFINLIDENQLNKVTKIIIE